MASVRVTGVRTTNQHGQTATLFDPFSDALALTLDVSISSDLVGANGYLTAAFQIIDPLTNGVVVNDVWAGSSPWANVTLWKGNNWGPQPSDYMTAERWGLRWTRPDLGRGVYGLRGFVKANVLDAHGNWTTADAFSVSNIWWFRLVEVYRV